MENYAEASCILKVNIHCQACKMRILEVLGSICGEYNIDINTEEGLVRVYALVEPNLLMKALSRTGYHAELKWAKLQHPRVNRNYYDNGYDSYNHHQYGYNYGAIDNHTYSYNQALPYPLSYPSQNYPTTRSIHPYYHRSDPNYHYGSGMTPTRYVPSYPPREYDPYADEPISFCSIMWSNACRRPRPFGF